MQMIFQVRPLLGQGKWNFNTEVCDALDLLQTLARGLKYYSEITLMRKNESQVNLKTFFANELLK